MLISFNLKEENYFSLHYEQSIYSLKHASAQACETETKKAGERHLTVFRGTFFGQFGK